MKRILLFLLISIIWFGANAQTIRYVAPNPVGDGSGLSASNAADFLKDAFWQEVQNLLDTQPVTVKFLGGDYVRAYTEKSLMIVNMGNVQNRLVLEADPLNTIFTLPTGYATKPQVLKVSNSINITVKNFNFTGNGSANYVLNITTNPGYTTNNILVENCTWTDMRGVVYGATGATLEGTHHITFKNCTFKRVGKDAGSHMIYNAYSSHHISVIDSYFEDCPGDYVRFRDKCDFGVVKGCTFVHPQNIPSIKFIAMPLYNDGIPTIGNESFATNYSFTNNSFTSSISNVYAFFISNRGYTAPGFNYLLTAQEGAILTGGTSAEKKELLETNFGIYPQKIRIANNTFTGVAGKGFLASNVDYGAVSKGWTGSAEITSLFNTSTQSFAWESETDQSGTWVRNDTSWAYSFEGSGSLGNVFSSSATSLTSSATTSTTPGFLPPSPSGTVMVTRTSGAKHSLLGNQKLKISGSDTNNPVKFAGYDIPGSSPVTSLAFTIQFNDSTSTRSIWTCVMGNNSAPESGQVFSNNSALTATGSTSNPEVFGAFTWEVSRTSPNVVSFGYRIKPQSTGNASNKVVNTTFFKRGETYKMEVYCNNTDSDQEYIRSNMSYTVASRSYHIWANSFQLVNVDQLNFPANQLANGLDINAFMIFGTNSTSTVYPAPIVGDNSAEVIVSDFKLNFANETLPVSLISFTGKKISSGIELNWETASEKNNLGFDILRSNDGIIFNEIGEKASVGDSNKKNTYSFIDQYPLLGINYYKLRQTDKDGQATIFDQIVKILTDFKGTELNLVRQQDGQLVAQIYATTAGQGQIKVLDIKGQVITRQTLQLKAGNNNPLLPVSFLPAGVYVVVLELQGETLSNKYIL